MKQLQYSIPYVTIDSCYTMGKCFPKTTRSPYRQSKSEVDSDIEQMVKNVFPVKVFGINVLILRGN